MCLGVSFHRHVPLTSAFEDSVHQLQWNSCPLEALCLFFFIKIGDFKHKIGLWLQVAPVHPLNYDRMIFLSYMYNFMFINGSW